MKEKIYISGKINGLPKDVSTHLFSKAEHYLISLGYKTLNPWTINHTSDKWEDMIIEDLKYLKKCSGIYMLSNWKDSYGATVEYNFAKGMGLKILFEQTN
ncbi:DUF4406 domain-containing protein [bacterium]|nr:DUF4406 domain-containing protein [bacterium]